MSPLGDRQAGEHPGGGSEGSGFTGRCPSACLDACAAAGGNSWLPGSGAPERQAQACLLYREPRNPCAGLAEPQSTTYKQQGQENRTPNSVMVGVNPLGYRVQSRAFTQRA